MLKNKQSKVKKMRGTSSHGWGHKKKHRGSGHRGGFGLAGTGARGDSQKAGLLARSTHTLKKISATRGIKLKEIRKSLSKKEYFGKKGFTSILKKDNKTLSIRHIENHFDKLIEMGTIEKKGSEFIYDTTKKYDKVLGKNKFSKKLTLIVNEISESAKKMVEAAGGKIQIKGEKKEKSPVKEEKETK